jgi:GNAT superfamily N-acetyltransferase
VRPIRADDKALLREGFERLSEVSRYRRCAQSVRELTEEQLRYFTEIDYRDHMAWVAVDAAQPSLGLGVARYIRFRERPNTAEVAITVVDSHQGRGLGTLLLSVLARSAVQHGITTWVAYVVSDNTPMLHLFRDLGAGAATLEERGLMRVEPRCPVIPTSFRTLPPQRCSGS